MRLLVKTFTVLAAISVTGCSATNVGLGNREVPSLPDVKPSYVYSAYEFNRAQQAMTISVDEFKGNFEVYPPVSLFDLFREGSSSASLSVDITKADSSSPWEFNLVTSYSGEEWMFHDELDIKSSAGVFIYNLDSSNRNDQTTDSGTVTEFAGSSLSKNEIDLFCRVIDQNDVKARLSGTGGNVQSITGLVPNADKLKSSCIIWYGLKQGLELSK
jgi:hypothetical protein